MNTVSENNLNHPHTTCPVGLDKASLQEVLDEYNWDYLDNDWYVQLDCETGKVTWLPNDMYIDSDGCRSTSKQDCADSNQYIQVFPPRNEDYAGYQQNEAWNTSPDNNPWMEEVDYDDVKSEYVAKHGENDGSREWKRGLADAREKAEAQAEVEYWEWLYAEREGDIEYAIIEQAKVYIPAYWNDEYID